MIHDAIVPVPDARVAPLGVCSTVTNSKTTAERSLVWTWPVRTIPPMAARCRAQITDTGHRTEASGPLLQKEILLRQAPRKNGSKKS
jgi:hypothetical protein